MRGAVFLFVTALATIATGAHAQFEVNPSAPGQRGMPGRLQVSGFVGGMTVDQSLGTATNLYQSGKFGCANRRACTVVTELMFKKVRHDPEPPVTHVKLLFAAEGQPVSKFDPDGAAWLTRQIDEALRHDLMVAGGGEAQCSPVRLIN